MLHLLKFKPDIIHIITFERFASVIFIYKIFSKAKVIYSAHGLVTLENEIKNVSAFYKYKDKICEKMFLRFSDKIIFPSEYYINKAYEIIKFDKDRTTIIPNGVDEIFHNIYNRRTNSNDKLKVIIETYKIGVSKIIDSVLAGLNTVKDNIELHLINPNDISYKYDTLTIFNYNKMPVSEFAGFLKDKDVLLSLAEFDTFSISTAEAMAAGVIPFVTKSTGIVSYINNNSNGFIHDYNNIPDILEKLMNPENRKKISEKASDIYSLLNWDTVYSVYESVYNDLA